MPVLVRAALAIAILTAVATPLAAQPGDTAGVRTMSRQARGAFEVVMTPQPASDGAPAGGHARYGLAKTFSGGMVGSSTGEMLGQLQDGSGAYVVIERFSGALDGRDGAFSLVHRGVMTGGAPELTVTIVPGSGDGDLAGIVGSMSLVLEGGRHDYVLDYTLPSR